MARPEPDLNAERTTFAEARNRATAELFDRLGLDRLRFNDFHFGCGTVRASHGELPLPVPAVAPTRLPASSSRSPRRRT